MDIFLTAPAASRLIAPPTAGFVTPPLVRLNRALGKKKKEKSDQEVEEKAARRLAFNPYAEAIETSLHMDHQRRVIALLAPPDLLPPLGARIDLKS